ncbi:MAG: hypothetical protein KKC99_07435 [Proteobacteria bacterium]|nr:hypothetical protein [Pseudomonadota bacterium]
MTQTEWINAIEAMAALGLLLFGLGVAISAINALWRTITGKTNETPIQQ